MTPVDRDLEPTPAELDREPQPAERPAVQELAAAADQGLKQAKGQLRTANQDLRALDFAKPGGPSDQRTQLETQAAQAGELARDYEAAGNLARDVQGNPELDSARLEATKHVLDELETREQGLAPDQKEFRQQIEADMESAIGQAQDASGVIAAVPGVDRSPSLDDITSELAQDLADPSALERAAGNILDPSTMFAILDVQQQVYDMQLKAGVANQELRRSVESAPDDLAGRALMRTQIDGLKQELRRVNNLLEIGKQLMRNQVTSAMKAAAKSMANVVEDLPVDKQKAVFEALARSREARKLQGDEREFMRHLEELLSEVWRKAGYSG